MILNIRTSVMRLYLEFISAVKWIAKHIIIRSMDMIQSRVVMSLFYVLAGTTFIVLHYTLPEGVRSGVAALEEGLGIRWWVSPFVFIACGWLLALKNSPTTYMLLCIPALLYAVGLAWAALTGGVSPLGWLGSLYLMLAALIVPKAIHQEYRQEHLSLKIEALTQRVNETGASRIG